MTENLASVTNNPNTNDVTSTSSPANMQIDEGAFLKLFIETLKNQDPSEPMSNSEMMSTFTQLAQMQNANSMTSILKDLSSTITGQNPIGNYLDLMGMNVIVNTGNGHKQGLVISVANDNGNVMFEMENGDSYSVSDIVGASKF